MNKTLIRGTLTVLAGIATLIGAIPAEVQEAIVMHAEHAVGAVTALWGIVATARGLKKRKAEQSAA